MSVAELGTFARAIIDESLYVVLGTADEHGMPWVTPVYCAPADYRDFYWISSPEVTHSRNIVVQPQISMVVFDSRQRPGSGWAVYMAAHAQRVADEDTEEALRLYNGRFAEPGEHGLRPFRLEDVTGSAQYRLWRATVSRYFVLCPREPGRPCAEHGRAFDHRTEITL